MIRSAPRKGREATPHWRAARGGRLLMPLCPACDHWCWPPAAACPVCQGPIEWRECSGHGRLLTFSVVRRAVQPEWQDEVPYAVGFVQLDEGCRLLSNILGADPAELACGMRLRCEFVETSDPELGLPVFRPAAE
jgi:uncharacterized OB-fold protein